MSGAVILPVTPLSQNSGKFWPAFLLALFLGVFGAHRFYLRSPKRVWMLLTLGGFGIWTFIDIITILIGNFKDEHGQKIANPKPGVSWAIFALVMIFGCAGQSEKAGSTSKPSSAAVSQRPTQNAYSFVENRLNTTVGAVVEMRQVHN